MIFLKYANDRFDTHREQMIAAGQQAFPEMMPFYTKDNVFYIPECARWSFRMENAKQADIAIKIDTALHEIEMSNMKGEQKRTMDLRQEDLPNVSDDDEAGAEEA